MTYKSKGTKYRGDVYLIVDPQHIHLGEVLCSKCNPRYFKSLPDNKLGGYRFPLIEFNRLNFEDEFDLL